MGPIYHRPSPSMYDTLSVPARQMLDDAVRVLVILSMLCFLLLQSLTQALTRSLAGVWAHKQTRTRARAQARMRALTWMLMIM